MNEAAQPSLPRVVITGIGIVAPNGIGKEAFWQACISGISGIRQITRFDRRCLARTHCWRSGRLRPYTDSD